MKPADASVRNVRLVRQLEQERAARVSAEHKARALETANRKLKVLLVASRAMWAKRCREAAKPDGEEQRHIG